MYRCPGCGSLMTFDISSQQLKCGQCSRTMSIEEADRAEVLSSGSSFSMDLLTCPSCGAQIRAMNTAAASFCSYCGASVMLDRKDSAMEAPETIAPFQITREQCFEQYRSMLRKNPFAPRWLKKDVTAESFRGIYVPQYEYSASVTGETVLEGHETEGDDTYYYHTTVKLDHAYDHILHDASREMPDQLSEKIASVEPDAFRKFSPAYISGFYADMPDTKPEEYMGFAKSEAVSNGLREVIEDLKDGCTYSTAEAEKKLVELAKARYTGMTWVPTWFMSIRSGKRVLYAIQNGVSGHMAADIPMDIPRFGLGVLILAVPLFFLFNAVLTLRPEMVMVFAMLLALVAQVIIYQRERAIRVKEIRSSPDAKPMDVKAFLKARKSLDGRENGTAALILRILGMIFFVAGMVAVPFVLSRIDQVGVFVFISLVLTALMGLMLYLGFRTGVKPPNGSLAAFAVMLAGFGILATNVFHSQDMPVYIVGFLCLACVVWESVDLLLMHNRECSNALPQFESHQGGEKHA